MEKYTLVCWLFGEPELTAEEIRNLLRKISPEEKENVDFFSVLEGGDLENNLQAVREIAKRDFIFDAVDFVADFPQNWEEWEA